MGPVPTGTVGPNFRGGPGISGIGSRFSRFGPGPGVGFYPGNGLGVSFAGAPVTGAYAPGFVGHHHHHLLGSNLPLNYSMFNHGVNVAPPPQVLLAPPVVNTTLRTSGHLDFVAPPVSTLRASATLVAPPMVIAQPPPVVVM